MKRRIILLLLLVLILVGLFPLTGKLAHAATIYYASPGDNLTAKVNAMSAGDTLLLNDGVYYSPLSVQGKVGTAAAPFTIKAVNDGKAIIDGSQITTNFTPPVFIGQGSAYIDLEGIVARNAPASTTNTSFDESVVYVYGSSNSQGGADHITLRRITAYNAGYGDVHVFNISFGATNVLVEDCAAWGRGRYDFIAYQTDHVTFRRDWAHWEPGTTFNAPRSPFSVYGSTNVTLENDIGTNAVPTSHDTNFFTGIFATTSTMPTTNMVVRGSMFYGNCEGPWVNDSVGNGTVFQDDYFDVPSISACPTDGVSNYGDGLSWQSTAGSGSFNNVTFANSIAGFHRGSTSDSAPPITNSVFYKNGTGIANDPGHSYSDWFGNGSNGTTLVGSDVTSDPGYNTTTFGRGAYLFIPSTSPLHGAGSGGADIGANAIYEYVDGTLTSTPLWPWPMESRILAERGISVTWASSGGIWNTLSGVYPNLIQNPSFESGNLTPWVSVVTAPAVATVSVDNTVAEAGIDSGKINVTTSNPNWWYVALRQNTIPLVANHLYTLSFWVKADATRNLTYTVQNNTGSVTYVQHTVSAGTGWTQVSTTFTPTVSDSTAQLWVGSATSTGTLWVDNVSLS